MGVKGCLPHRSCKADSTQPTQPAADTQEASVMVMISIDHPQGAHGKLVSRELVWNAGIAMGQVWRRKHSSTAFLIRE